MQAHVIVVRSASTCNRSGVQVHVTGVECNTCNRSGVQVHVIVVRSGVQVHVTGVECKYM